MNGHVILSIICDIDLNTVTFPSINSRPWEPAIHCYNRFCMAQPANIIHLYLKFKKKIKIQVYQIAK